MRPTTDFLKKFLKMLSEFPNGFDYPNFSGLTNRELIIYLARAEIPAHQVEGLDNSFTGCFSSAESQAQLQDHEKRR